MNQKNVKKKSFDFRPNNARYEKILKSKIDQLQEIYKFDFDYFLIKRKVFVLIVKNVSKNEKFIFPDKLCDAKQMLRNKIVRFKKINKFYLDHFLTKCTVFVLIVKNVIKNQKFNFQGKLCDVQKNVMKQNCLFQKDLRILILTIF